MAITKFKFPGVELRQEVVSVPVTGESQLGVVIVGPACKSNTYTGWVYGGTASTIDFSDRDYCTLDDATDAETWVLDGLFKGYQATSSTTEVAISASTITGGTTAEITFGTASIAENEVFGSLPPEIGDTVDVTGTNTVPAVITDIDGAVVTVEVIGSTALTGSSVTAVDFYKIADGKIDNATTSEKVVSIPATPTAKIGGQDFNSTLQNGTYTVREKYDIATEFSRGSIDSLDAIYQRFGEVNNNNYMALALSFALQAAKENIVYYIGVKEETADGYKLALDFLDKYADLYSIVPLTYDAAIIKDCISKAESTATNVESKIRRTVWYGLETPASNIKDGLIAKRKEIGTSERAQAVWADNVLYHAEVVPNFVVAAAPAGMRSYEPAYRPISNLEYTFFNVLDTNGLTNSDLLSLGADGIWIIDNNYDDVPVNKRQVTTAVANDLNLDEESIVANADSIALTLCHVGEKWVGCSNISPVLLKVLTDTITNIMESYLINYTGNPYIGPQLLSWSLDSIYQHPTMLDHIYAVITCEPPKPFNRFVMTLRIV